MDGIYRCVQDARQASADYLDDVGQFESMAKEARALGDQACAAARPEGAQEQQFLDSVGPTAERIAGLFAQLGELSAEASEYFAAAARSADLDEACADLLQKIKQ